MADYVDMRSLGERVLLLRRRADLSQHELARLAGMDVMTISRLERGGKKRLEVEQLARLSKALQVTTDYLLGFDDTPTPPAKRPRPRKAAPVG
jgi:transcriptional regulator with XRE-family HTH domain